jgi:lipopolysaccharide/colanic/teichoic acid biosynthesis glycosyltransferase
VSHSSAARVIERRKALSERRVESRATPKARSRTSAPPRRRGATDARAPFARLNAAWVSQRAFAEQVRLEERRADRTEAALSVAVFELGSERDGGDLNAEFLQFLSVRKRETDTLGSIAQNRVALLLPDTGVDGVRALVDQITDEFRDLALHATTATYPKQSLESLIAKPECSIESPAANGSVFSSEARTGYRLKRGLDLMGASVLVVLFAPLMLFTAVVVALTSRGPVIFKQMRLGKGGVPFVFYKFRSMTANADDRVHREYVTRLIAGQSAGLNQGNGSAPLFKLKADPRVTRVGRFIRKTSIDELPQLFNVLKGEMSLVGPRPPLPYEAEKYQSWHMRRLLDLKPGITGVWQVEGRSKTSFDDMVRLDLRYMDKCSLWQDLKILLKTVKVVLMCNGAR